MITSPYSNLLTAYPHLHYEFDTIPANEVTYATLQSWSSQETPLPQAFWNVYHCSLEHSFTAPPE